VLYPAPDWGQTQSRWVPSLTVDSKLPAVRQAAGPQALARDSAGLLLGRLSVLPALLTLPFLLTSFPLLLIGWFKPVPVILLWLAASAVIVPMAWRRLPSVSGAPDYGTASEGRATPTPRWTLWAVVGISVLFGLFQAAYHSQFIIVMLDPASYMQFANWISQHGSLPIPENAAAFGNASGVTYASAAFYQVGTAIQPQFMAGLPMVLSLGFWTGGARLAVFMGPLLGALAVLTFGGLAARLIGPRWAPFAALTLGITLPEQYTSRGTFSEPLAQILFLGALSLWIDSQRTDRGEQDAGPWRANWRVYLRSRTHLLAAIAGLLFGITLLVRVDGPSDILFLVPYCAILALQRRRQVIPLIVGTIVGLLYGTVDGVFLALDYLKTNKQSVEAMTAAFVLVTAVTWVWLWWRRRRGLGLPVPGPRLVRAGTLVPFVLIAAFIIRPYVERNWHALQYAPLSLHWVYWYTGYPIIFLAVIAASMLTRRCLQGQAPVWTLPLLLLSWTIVEFLLRPAITAHQPWASRRLVPGVLPGLILLAVWLAAWLTRRSHVVRLVNVPRRWEKSPRGIAIAICSAAIILPPMVANFGFGLKSGGPFGIMPYSDGLALQRTYVGEIAAVDELCKSIPKDSSVLIADFTLNQQFGEVIRGMCGVPTAGVQTEIPNANTAPGDNVAASTILADVRAVEKAGRRPVVLAPTSAELASLGNGTVNFIMNQDTTIDGHNIFGTPRNPVIQRFTVYSWEPAK
jgi:hypothetical protein